MKFSTAVVLSAVMVALPSPSLMVKADPCIIGTYELEFDGGCDYATLLESFKHKYQTMIKTADCANDAETELLLHLGSPADPAAAVRALCIPAWDNAFSVPFEDIARMPQADFEQRYYNGGTDWNEEVETLYEDPLGERSNILRVDAQRVRQFYEQESEHARVDVPSYNGSDLTNNFDPSTCSTQAVMCCWTTDRQANDGNGNCDDPYDLKCVDKDPADNTDLCYVDLERGNTSTEFDSFEGTMVYPGGNNDGEGPMHCHGYAWAEDKYDFTARYAANNLFFVSMYDHMTQRGYVRNVQGAPMCACTDQMPVVTRSDCTQIDPEETYMFHFKGIDAGFEASLTHVEIEFNSCQGWNNQNNDLWAYMQRLYYEDKKVSSATLATLSETLVEDDACPYVADAYLATKGYTFGYNVLPEEWIQVAGRDILDIPSYGKFSFNEVLDAIEGDIKILRRVCIGCDHDTHVHIYYRRLTPIPEECELLDLLKNSYSATEQATCNVFNTDFTVHSSYGDAVKGQNAWSCILNADGTQNYMYNQGFPGDCSPSGVRVENEDSRFNPPGGENDVGWYVESSDFRFNAPGMDRNGNALTSTDIGAVRQTGHTHVVTDPVTNANTYYISAAGNDIWNTKDEFHFLNQPMAAGSDFSVSVHLIELDHRHDWTKAGLMIRESLDPSSKHASVFVFGTQGAQLMYRKEYNGYSGHVDRPKVNVDEAYLMLSKKGNMYTAFMSMDGVDWFIIGEMKIVFDAASAPYVGLALTAHDYYDTAEAVFDKYELFKDQVASITCARVFTASSGTNATSATQV